MSIHLYGRLIIYTTCYLSHVVLVPGGVKLGCIAAAPSKISLLLTEGPKSRGAELLQRLLPCIPILSSVDFLSI